MPWAVLPASPRAVRPLTPPRNATTLPSMPVPVPNGILILHAVETQLARLGRFSCRPVWSSHPETVIGRNRLFFSTEKSGERQADGLRQEIPGRHVDTCHSHPGKTLRSKQSETSLEFLRQSQRCYRITFDQRLQGFDEVCDRLKSNRGITKQVSAAGQLLVRFQIYENERSRFDYTAGRRMRTRQRHIHRGCSQAADFQG